VHLAIGPSAISFTRNVLMPVIFVKAPNKATPASGDE
jgi:hypothetical protein